MQSDLSVRSILSNAADNSKYANYQESKAVALLPLLTSSEEPMRPCRVRVLSPDLLLVLNHMSFCDVSSPYMYTLKDALMK
jgi:hypothetical protein